MIKGRFIKKNKTKSGCTRYYIYDDDEKLVVSAEVQRIKPFKCYVSRSSTDFSEQGEHFLGKCKYDDTTTTMRCTANDGEQRQIKAKIGHQNKTPSPEYQIDGITQNLPELVGGEWMLGERKYSSPDAEFTKDGQQCFSIVKEYEDEYLISYNLSLFEGMCLAIMIEISQE